MVNGKAIYVLWLREMKRFLRNKSRIIGTLTMPLLFLAFLGFGFGKFNFPGLQTENYLQFVVPGVVAMSIVITSTFGGVSVLWDKEFGFLKEIMVAPIDRVSIVLGRIAGTSTTSIIQAHIILLISFMMGFKTSQTILISFLSALVFMTLISIIFVGLGLSLATLMSDFQGFGMIMNFIIFPLLFFSGAIFPIENLPKIAQKLVYLNPLTYGVDGLRAAYTTTSLFPPILDLTALLIFATAMVGISTYFFEKSEV